MEDTGIYKGGNNALMDKIREQARDAMAATQRIERKVAGLQPRVSPFIGETVLYKMPDGPTVGELRPAIVLRVHDNGMTDVRVITDTEYDPSMGVVRMVKHGHQLAHWMAIGEERPLE
jgi:hypothetical protein